MYVLMFLTAIRLRKKSTYPTDTFKIPGGQAGLMTVCLFGFVGCAITLLVGFIPPDSINVGSKLQYFAIFSASMTGMVLPVLFFYWYRAKNLQQAPVATESPVAVLEVT
jgi:hypothetical protein